MEIKNFFLLALLLIIAFIPLLFKKETCSRIFPGLIYFLPAILFSSTIFLILDTRFAQAGILNFNPAFFSGKSLASLPWEMWLFYPIVGWVSLFTYEWVKIKFPNAIKANVAIAISLVLLVVFSLTAFFFRQKIYTFFVFFLLAIYFGYTIFRNRFKRTFASFYLAFLILAIPLFIFTAILTNLPVIEFNAIYMLNINIFKVPIEIFAIYFMLLLINATIFEYLSGRRFF
ncbi:MAG: hypothetical protein CSA36_04540 [Draconibacterium sp.]|nr:MAG: hypothetical protein CSA36_04540 [Draconibacterium sp.]